MKKSAKSSTQRSKTRRELLIEQGRKEMRGVIVRIEHEDEAKQHVREFIDRLEKRDDKS